MTPRERNLAIIVGSLAFLIVGWFAVQGVLSSYQDRRNKISELESKLSQQRLQVLQGAAATRKRNEYEARSLPSQDALARSLYQRWLLERVQEADFDKPLVNPISSRPEGNVLTRHQFNVTGRAKLDAVVKFLYDFHRVNTLHRISRLTIRPIKDSKELDLQISVEALALRIAPPDGKLPLEPSPKLADQKLEAFAGPILDRNLFGPANRPPQIASATPSVETNRSADFSVKATDPDSLDKVTYRIVEGADSSASIDPASGRFRWTPRKPGRYDFVVEAIDDGIPAKSSQRKITVAVNDRPPPPAPEPKKLAFDDAKFTVLTAILDADGESEIWLLVRPQGKTLKLQAGDKFQVGSIDGQVVAIGRDDFSFEADGKLRRLTKGGILEQAEIESTTSAEAPPAGGEVN